MRDWNADYATVLQSSNLPTLAGRSHHLKLCFLYEVIQGQFDFLGTRVVRINLPLKLGNNSTFLLLRPVTCSSAHHLSCFSHAIYLWNSLHLQYIIVFSFEIKQHLNCHRLICRIQKITRSKYNWKTCYKINVFYF